jgi:hypothetical protein
MRKNIHALSGIRTNGLSVQAIKGLRLRRAATEIGKKVIKSRVVRTILERIELALDF